MISLIILFVILSTSPCKAQSQEWLHENLQHGDLLFNIHSSSTDFGDAIVAATKGNSNVSISHVAIAMAESGSISVLEATGQHGVRVCPIDTFINNADHTPDGQPLILVARLKDRSTIDASVKRAMKYIGRPYDWVFSDTDDALYCSELVHLSFLDSDGNHIFPQQPMSFHDSTGAILPYWIDYYKQRGLEVPEGAPGTNPSDISKSDKINIIPFNEQ